MAGKPGYSLRTSMSPSRRDLLKTLAAAPLLFAPQRQAAETTVSGVVFGVETFSFQSASGAGGGAGGGLGGLGGGGGGGGLGGGGFGGGGQL